MKIRNILFILPLITVLPAFAEMTPSEACRMLEVHTPAPDVAYTDGYDVRGNAVVSAELGGSLPLGINTDNVTIPIGVDLNDALGIAPTAGLINEAHMGYINVKDGQVAVNEQILSDETLRDLAVLCLDALKETKEK